MPTRTTRMQQPTCKPNLLPPSMFKSRSLFLDIFGYCCRQSSSPLHLPYVLANPTHGGSIYSRLAHRCGSVAILRAPYLTIFAPRLPEPSINTPSELNKNPPEGVSVGLSDDDNMFMWELLIVGPADTVSGGLPRLLRCNNHGQFVMLSLVTCPRRRQNHQESIYVVGVLNTNLG